VASLVIEHFAEPSSGRDARALDFARSRAVDELAGRTVWCATALPAGRTAAQRLRTCLEWAGPEGVGAAWMEVFQEGMRDGEAMVGGGVRPDDVVVLHDPLTAVLAQAIRERGAHAVLHIRIGAETEEPAGRDARTFLRDHTPAVHAFVASWSQPLGRGVVVDRIAAHMPCAGVVAAKDVASAEPYHEVGWSALLADVVHGDREESVGGTLHPRPSVAAR
jgi:hypothetical protein